jgi:hypothetical protein
MKTPEEILKEALERGFVVLASSEDKALADRLVREGKLTAASKSRSGLKRYHPAPPPKAKKRVTCKCGVTFWAWTAGACGACKAKPRKG